MLVTIEARREWVTGSSVKRGPWGGKKKGDPRCSFIWRAEKNSVRCQDGRGIPSRGEGEKREDHHQEIHFRWVATYAFPESRNVPCKEGGKMNGAVSGWGGIGRAKQGLNTKYKVHIGGGPQGSHSSRVGL